MLRNRLIFTLIYDDGFFNQSRNFRLQKVGDLNWLKKNYKFQDISFSLDELIVLDATRGKQSLKEFSNIVEQLVENVFIPVAAGGGVRTLKDAQVLFESGADKIVLNSLLIEDIEMVQALIEKYGKQSIVVSIDYKENDVFIRNGSHKIDMSLRQYIDYLETIGVGEIYLNSIAQDGTGFGYDLDTVKEVSKSITVPLIIAGGAGNYEHLHEGLKVNNVDAVATANLFNFIGDGLPKVREKLLVNNFNFAEW